MLTKNENSARKVVVLDVDGTIVSGETLGNHNREMFYKDDTIAVINRLTHEGHKVIIHSHKTSVEVMKNILKDVNNIDSISFYNDQRDKTQIAEEARIAGDYGYALVVDDNINAVQTSGVMQIVVPTAPAGNRVKNTDVPESNNYLWATLASIEELQAKEALIAKEAVKRKAGYLTPEAIQNLIVHYQDLASPYMPPVLAPVVETDVTSAVVSASDNNQSNFNIDSSLFFGVTGGLFFAGGAALIIAAIIVSPPSLPFWLAIGLGAAFCATGTLGFGLSVSMDSKPSSMGLFSGCSGQVKMATNIEILISYFCIIRSHPIIMRMRSY